MKATEAQVRAFNSAWHWDSAERLSRIEPPGGTFRNVRPYSISRIDGVQHSADNVGKGTADKRVLQTGI